MAAIIGNWKNRIFLLYAQAALKIYRENSFYRSGARDAAVAQFNIEKMLDGYLAALLG